MIQQWAYIGGVKYPAEARVTNNRESLSHIKILVNPLTSAFPHVTN